MERVKIAGIITLLAAGTTACGILPKTGTAKVETIEIISEQESSEETIAVTEPVYTETQNMQSADAAAVNPGMEDLREKAREAGCICAVAYIGYEESGLTEDVKRCAAESGLFGDSISDEQIVSLEGGEIYGIVPADAAAQVTVHRKEYNEEGLEVTGEMVYEGGGIPFLLVCNVSDIMPNSLITVCSKEGSLEFTPYMSLRDGKLAATAPEGMIYFYEQ